MCFKFRPPSTQPLPSQAPVLAKTNKTESDPLPESKAVVDPDDTRSVVYGSSKKQGGQAAANKRGADALRIPLNTNVAGGGASAGGANV